jgi:hypothetical protein
MLCRQHSLGEIDLAIDQAWRVYEKKHPETVRK